MSRTWYVRRLVTTPGLLTLGKEALAEQLRTRLEEKATDRLVRLSAHACDKARVNSRHLELPSGRRPGEIRAEEARSSMGKRAVARLLEGEQPPDRVIFVSEGGAELQEKLLPYTGIAPDRVMGASHTAAGLLLAHNLLTTGSAERVAVLCVEVAGTEAWARLERHPAAGPIIAATLASDGAAGIILSSEPGDAPRLAYADMLPAMRARQTKRAGVTGADAAELHDHLITEIDASVDDSTLPTLMLPGGSALLDLLAARHPALEPMVTISRTVLEQNGQLGAAAGLWLLDSALRDGMRLDPAFRLLATGPGLSAHALVLQGVDPHVRA